MTGSQSHSTHSRLTIKTIQRIKKPTFKKQVYRIIQYLWKHYSKIFDQQYIQHKFCSNSKGLNAVENMSVKVLRKNMTKTLKRTAVTGQVLFEVKVMAKTISAKLNLKLSRGSNCPLTIVTRYHQAWLSVNSL